MEENVLNIKSEPLTDDEHEVYIPENICDVNINTPDNVDHFSQLPTFIESTNNIVDIGNTNNKITVKRKRTVLSLQDKLYALKRLDNGETINKVAKELGVGTVTVGDWKRNREKIENWASQNCLNITENRRKSMKKSIFEKTSQALFNWFSEEKKKGISITGPMLQKKALELNKKFPDENDFAASAGWLDRFKKKHCIKQTFNYDDPKIKKLDQIPNYENIENYQKEVYLPENICDVNIKIFEKNVFEESTDSITSFKSVEDLKKLIEIDKLTSKQIYTCYETTLNYKNLPDEKNYERLTILACANQSADHKLKLLVIGKTQKPFKHVNIEALPVKYVNQKNASMTTHIFASWFHADFVSSVKEFLNKNNLPNKAILILDNSPTHPNELKTENIRVINLNYEVIRPLNETIVDNIKENYRQKLIKDFSNENLTENLNNIDYKSAIYCLADSWYEIDKYSLIKSWSTIFFNESFSDVQNNLVDNCIKEEIDYMEDIVSEKKDIDVKISHEDGLKFLQNALLYVVQQTESSLEQISVLKQLIYDAEKKIND